MTEREKVVRATVARAKAGKRRVFGYSSDKASCAELMAGSPPATWDRIAVEGDKQWTALPPLEAVKG